MNFIIILSLSYLTFSYSDIQFNKFTSAVNMIPHPDKVAKGGEDAYYTNDHFLAVADGVGGWNDRGVDPGLYSKKLV